MRNNIIYTMNLSESSHLDKELFSGERRWYENINSLIIYKIMDSIHPIIYYIII
jgi:hypothetical protein